MQVFLNKTYPDVTVVLVHSETNLFRYGENIEFAKHELRPVLDAYRDAHARGLAYPDEGVVLRSGFHDAPFSPDWKRSFHVTISYADGSPARTHAIQAALRPYRPHYLHHWQLKSFWHDAKIVDDDIESHDFEEMETVPAMEASRIIDNEVKLVIAEMQAFRLEFLHIMLEGRSDIRDFWLRKTRKPVLAVLLVQSAGSSKPILYRGTNMEVSMPTGSLCAERNVIGTALASDPGLKRQDLKMVAVLAVPLPPDKDAQVPMSRNWSFASYSSLVQAADSDTEQQTDDWVLPGREVEQRLDQAVERRPRSESLAEDPPGTPMRRIRLYNNAAADNKARRARRSVLVHCSDQDLNPLRPCGACNEWLKKISESNPYFSVVTFTDAECKGVYVTPCQE
jgi:cytidine deaminase